MHLTWNLYILYTGMLTYKDDPWTWSVIFVLHILSCIQNNLNAINGCSLMNSYSLLNNPTAVTKDTPWDLGQNLAFGEKFYYNFKLITLQVKISI